MKLHNALQVPPANAKGTFVKNGFAQSLQNNLWMKGWQIKSVTTAGKKEKIDLLVIKPKDGKGSRYVTVTQRDNVEDILIKLNLWR